MKKLMSGIISVSLPVIASATAWADAAAGAVPGGEVGGAASFLPLIGYIAFFGIIMYVMVYLPQKRKDKKAKELLNSLQVGYKITTHSGMVGKVVNIKDDVVTIESSVERTQIELKKWAIKDVDKPIEA